MVLLEWESDNGNKIPPNTMRKRSPLARPMHRHWNSLGTHDFCHHFSVYRNIRYRDCHILVEGVGPIKVSTIKVHANVDADGINAVTLILNRQIAKMANRTSRHCGALTFASKCRAPNHQRRFSWLIALGRRRRHSYRRPGVRESTKQSQV